MASELSSLIKQLQSYQPIGTNPRPRALNFIIDYQRFITTLENINEMIGLEMAKRQIAHQVKSFIVNYRRFGKPTNGEKLHTLLYGPPGCGKTQLGQYLAELWASSGCLPVSDTKVDFRSLQRDQAVQLSEKSSKVNSIAQSDTEKITLRQNLTIKEAQLRQYQEKLYNNQLAINSTLTLFNNVRKKIKAKSVDQEQRIQAKFQEIKKQLKTLVVDEPGYQLKPVNLRTTGNPIAVLSKVENGASIDEQLSSENIRFSGYDNPKKLAPFGIDNLIGSADFSSSSERDSPVKHSTPEILPVIIPKNPGAPCLFGTYSPPLLPHVPASSSEPANTPSHKSIEERKSIAKFTRLTRGDLIGRFQGHTTDQVRKILMEHIGGVVMIDEAYNLCTSGQDDFGKEALTEIINFMTTWPDKIIFIFAGYRKEMEETVLRFQPGLPRRFNWTFEINEYTSDELCLIFKQQLKKNSWSLNEECLSLTKTFFKNNKAKFPHFGGDTERLCAFVKETFNQENWMSALDDNISQTDYENLFTDISFTYIQKAFEKYLQNSVKEKEEEKKREEEERFAQIRPYMYG